MGYEYSGIQTFSKVEQHHYSIVSLVISKVSRGYDNNIPLHRSPPHALCRCSEEHLSDPKFATTLFVYQASNVNLFSRQGRLNPRCASPLSF